MLLQTVQSSVLKHSKLSAIGEITGTVTDQKIPSKYAQFYKERCLIINQL